MSNIKQVLMEELFDKNQLIPAIKGYFEEAFGEVLLENEEKYGIPAQFSLDVLTQAYLHKQARAEVFLGTLINKWKDMEQICRWIEKLAELDAIDYGNNRIIVKHHIPLKLAQDIDKFQYPMPMIIEPKEVTCNEETGYITQRGSIILRNNHHNKDVCLDHINRSNKIKLAINLDTANAVANKVANLSAAKEGESFEDFQKRVTAWEKFAKHTGWVHDLLETQATEGFYLTHKYDKRGRTYCQGYYVNYQGHDFNKAVVEFANKETIEL